MPNPMSAGLPNRASYVDNGNGTVTDQITGLVWQRLASGAKYRQADAARYCPTQGPQWRLPTRLELVSLVDFTVASPGPTINQAFPGTPGEVFWTSSPAAGHPNSGWGVSFEIGYADFDDLADPARLRCVSTAGASAHCYPSRYQVKASGEVYDAATKLTWQQEVTGASYQWRDATAYCAGLSGGWRLPSMTELQTLVDDTKPNSTIDPTAFPHSPVAVFWTSSPVAGQPYAWGVDFTRGTTINPDVTTPYRVRCVR